MEIGIALDLVVLLIPLVIVGILLLTSRARPRARPQRPGFRCPSCGAFRVVITASLDLPGDMTEDEINLQAIACRRCPFVGAAVYCESSRGSLDRDCWSHNGYRMRQPDYDRLQAAIGRCPTQANRACTCATHAELGRQERDQWVWLGGIPCEGTGFDMEMEPRR